MRKEFRTKLKGDDSRADASAYFTLPFDTRKVWGKVKVPFKVTINGSTTTLGAARLGTEAVSSNSPENVNVASATPQESVEVQCQESAGTVI